MNICYKCKKVIPEDLFIGRQTQCPYCGADLHCCLNCSFYEVGAYNDCRNPQSERVLEKDRANFCDYFKFKQSLKTSGTIDSGAKDKLESLFNKTS